MIESLTMTGAPYTSDFRREYDAGDGRPAAASVLLAARGERHGVRAVAAVDVPDPAWRCCCCAPGAVVDASLAKTIDGIRMGKWGIALVLGLGVVDIGMYIWAGMYVARTHMQRDRLLAFTQWALVYRGVIGILIDVIMHAEGFPWTLGFYHILACSFLPWSPRQAMRPIGPLLVLNATAGGAGVCRHGRVLQVVHDRAVAVRGRARDAHRVVQAVALGGRVPRADDAAAVWRAAARAV